MSNLNILLIGLPKSLFNNDWKLEFLFLVNYTGLLKPFYYIFQQRFIIDFCLLLFSQKQIRCIIKAQ